MQIPDSVGPPLPGSSCNSSSGSSVGCSGIGSVTVFVQVGCDLCSYYSWLASRINRHCHYGPSGSAMISALSFKSRDSLGVTRLQVEVVSFPGVLILGLSLL